MSHFSRFLALFIAALLLFSLSACSSGSDEEVFESTLNTDIEHDYGGNSVVFYCPRGIIYDEETDSLFSDIVYSRVADVEHQFNVNISFDETEFDGVLKLAVAGGRYVCELAISDTYNMYDEIRANLLESLDDIDSGIDYTDSAKWGNKVQLPSFVYDNHLYGVIPMYWPGSVYKQCDHFFFVNEDMVASIGQPDPREFVDNGQWTRDKLTDLVENVYTHTNAASETVYALATQPGHFFSIAITASGIGYIVKKGEDTYVSAFKEPGVQDKLKWADDFYFRNYQVNIEHGSDTFDTIAYLVDNRSVMILTHLFYGLRDVQFTVDNFGILPFPLSDDIYGQGWIGQHEFFNNSVFIPINARDPESASFLADAIFEPLKGYETEELRLAYYDRYVFHDSRDTKVVFEALSNCRYLPYNDEGYMIPNAMTVAAGNKSISQILEEKNDLYETYMNDAYIPLQKSLDALFGED